MDFLVAGLGFGALLVLAGFAVRDLGPSVLAARGRIDNDDPGAVLSWMSLCHAIATFVMSAGGAILIATLAATLLGVSDSAGSIIVVVVSLLAVIACAAGVTITLRQHDAESVVPVSNAFASSLTARHSSFTAAHVVETMMVDSAADTFAGNDEVQESSGLEPEIDPTVSAAESDEEASATPDHVASVGDAPAAVPAVDANAAAEIAADHADSAINGSMQVAFDDDRAVTDVEESALVESEPIAIYDVESTQSLPTYPGDLALTGKSDEPPSVPDHESPRFKSPLLADIALAEPSSSRLVPFDSPLFAGIAPSERFPEPIHPPNAAPNAARPASAPEHDMAEAESVQRPDDDSGDLHPPEIGWDEELPRWNNATSTVSPTPVTQLDTSIAPRR